MGMDCIVKYYHRILSSKTFLKIRTSQLTPYIIIMMTIIAIKIPFILHIDGLIDNTGLDEFGTLATAACMAGKDWSEKLQTVSYYGFGYSILLVPIFFLFNDPALIYHFILLINAILLGVCGMLCYRVVTAFFKIKSKTLAVMISLAVTMFYSSFINADYGINETMLVLLVWIVIYILLALATYDLTNTSRNRYTLVLGVVISYSFLVHSRTLIIPCAIVVAIVMYRYQYKKWLMNPWIFIITVIAGYILSKWIIEWIQIKFWLKTPGEVMNNSTESLFEALGNFKLLFTYTGIKAFIYAIIGQVYSLFMLSGGFLALGCIVGCKMLKAHVENRPLKVLVYFIFASLTASLLLNVIVSLSITSEVIVSAPKMGQAKWFLYHRYNALFCSPIIMLTFVYLIKYKLELKKISFVSTIINFGVTSSFFLFVCRFLVGVTVRTSGVFFAFIPFMNLNLSQGFQVKDFIIFTILSFTFMLFMIYTMAHKNYILTCLIFIGFNFYNYAYQTIEISYKSAERTVSTYNSSRELVDSIKKNDVTLTYASYPRIKELYVPYDVQFGLNEITMHTMIPEKMGENSVLIISTPITQDPTVRRFFREFKLDENEYWYVRGEKAQEVVEKCYRELFE